MFSFQGKVGVVSVGASKHEIFLANKLIRVTSSPSVCYQVFVCLRRFSNLSKINAANDHSKV